MARVIPPEVRKAMREGDTSALSRMGSNGNRARLARKERRKAKFERGAIIFARKTPASDD